jgi:hypothetical protein
MTDADLLPPAVLKRKAVVYVRQSTQTQVQTNLILQLHLLRVCDSSRGKREDADGCGVVRSAA